MIAILLSLLSGALQTTPETPAYRIVGYYADWTAERYPLADIPAAKLPISRLR